MYIELSSVFVLSKGEDIEWNAYIFLMFLCDFTDFFRI